MTRGKEEGETEGVIIGESRRRQGATVGEEGDREVARRAVCQDNSDTPLELYKHFFTFIEKFLICSVHNYTLSFISYYVHFT